ncbi:unnamed protein product [Amaranthus hypochondriacus]
MDDTEKMTALKKAYAEIILNTAKEAAGRIMVSERKAHQFHHDLSTTKEESLRLLLRLKQTMDVKMNEAEMKSLNQQRRIEELEAQLQEAEDIVSNLRGELNEAHLKLEARKQLNNALHMSEKAHRQEETEHHPENGPSKPVVGTETNSSVKLANGNHGISNSVTDFGYSGDPVVPSIIMRSEKSELYRNGCTQRIRAYEGKLLNGHFSLSGELDDLKYEKAVREDKEREGKYITSNGDVKNVDRSRSKPQALKSFRKRKKRAARCRRSNTSLLNPIRFPAKETLPFSENSEKTCHDIHENGVSEVMNTHLHSPTTPSEVSAMGVLLKGIATTEDNDTVGCMVTVNEDTEVAGSLVLDRQQSGPGNCSDDQSSKQELETKNLSSVNLDSKLLEEDGGFLSPSRKDRVLKYTFQRKRKKESLSGDDSGLHEENPLKRRMVKKQNDNLEGSKSDNGSDSSRDSRRMAQVARQLISLSEKKWWK